MSDSAQSHQSGDKPTLKIAGVSYALGDVLMMVAGIARHGAQRAMGTIGGSALWLSGGLAAARYGNPADAQLLRIHVQKLQQFLHARGVEISPELQADEPLLSSRSLWRKVEDYCYAHPSELLNSAYGIGASMVLLDGVRELRQGSSMLPRALSLQALKGMSSSFWIGVLVLAGAVTGLCVKEDAKAREHAQGEGPLQQLAAWVKEKPLRLSGAFYTANNGFLALRAWQDFTERHSLHAGAAVQPYVASTLQLASYCFANSMLMLSQRDQTAGRSLPPALQLRLEQAAATIIAAQPQSVRAPLLHEIANHLSHHQGIATAPAQLESHLQQLLAARPAPTHVAALQQQREARAPQELLPR